MSYVDSLLVNWTILAGFAYAYFLRAISFPVQPRRWQLAAAAAALVTLFTTAALYVASPSYLNYGEVNVALVAEMWRRGEPIFAPLDSPFRYSLLYGPWTSIANGILHVKGPWFIQSTKAMGLVNMTAAFAAMAFVFKRGAKHGALVGTGVLALAFLGFDNYAYILRPDSFLIAYSALAMAAFVAWGRSRPALFWSVAGVLGGLSVACKAHGFVYFIPLAARAWETEPRTRSARGLGACAALGLAAALAPFWLPNVSLNQYRLLISAISKRGLGADLFFGNATYAAPWFVALVALGVAKSRPISFAALFVATALAGTFGSLVGGGTHHLMPLFGYAIWFAVERRERFAFAWPRAAVAGLLMALAYGAFISQKTAWNYLAGWRMEAERREELLAIRAKCGGPAAIGLTDWDRIELSYDQPEFASLGEPAIFDANAVMDMSASGIQIPNSTIAYAASCAVKCFLLPRQGRPWSMRSGFGFQMFSQNWIDAFDRDFEKSESSAHYDIYRCKPELRPKGNAP